MLKFFTGFDTTVMLHFFFFFLVNNCRNDISIINYEKLKLQIKMNWMWGTEREGILPVGTATFFIQSKSDEKYPLMVH